MSAGSPASSRERVATAALVLGATCLVVVRILLVEGPYADPDRSRFMTVQALLESGDYSVGARVPTPDGGTVDVGLVNQGFTVDVVLDPASQRFYSSKPPLLPTVVAGEVWLLERALGWRLDDDGTLLVRAVLLTFGALPFFVYLALLAGWLSSAVASARVRLYVLAFAGFGTFVTTFTTALNNHTLGAFTALPAVLATLALFERRGGALWLWLVAGACSGACATQELPAFTLVAACGFLLLTVDRLRAIVFFAPAALLPLLAFLGANALALGHPLFFFQVPTSWYEYDGAYWLQPAGLDAGEPPLLLYAFHLVIGHHGVFSLTPALLPALLEPLRALEREVPAAVRRALFVAGAALLVLLPAIVKKGLDLSDDLSFLPIAALGGGALLIPLGWWRDDDERRDALPRLAAACALPTLAFYLVETSNYGGITSGPRWLLWLTPLAVLLLPRPVAALDRTAVGRAALLAALVVSVFSALFVGLNPYQHPWLYELFAGR